MTTFEPDRSVRVTGDRAGLIEFDDADERARERAHLVLREGACLLTESEVRDRRVGEDLVDIGSARIDGGFDDRCIARPAVVGHRCFVSSLAAAVDAVTLKAVRVEEEAARGAGHGQDRGHETSNDSVPHVRRIREEPRTTIRACARIMAATATRPRPPSDPRCGHSDRVRGHALSASA
ncbi:MAG: hypothetical protein BGO98_35045 [Myxococcales bacterium 68-20]|nr:MAG: hypothetical protein BGO98_35045 [Myxococcales bacterium 68-20]